MSCYPCEQIGVVGKRAATGPGKIAASKGRKTDGGRDIVPGEHNGYHGCSAPAGRLVGLPRHHDRILRLYALWTDGSDRLWQAILSTIRSNDGADRGPGNLRRRLLRATAGRVGVLS